ncbi:hypothetical protein [Clostridium novyi]|uniref:hypothetical protein n=1 Tax=Clostridium novyi TaxID=1542 RepID=UPI0004D3A375|nr:hypothetical protein [Clostridium novyi]KEI08058.1 hypothetical protein Z958_p0140 [Clostridium novyi B str. NCTC 9691]KEI12783.1 hypothetical protein Z958_05820 [Clostridium novyi B str. NCTC 9691]
MNTTCVKCSKKFNVELQEKYIGAMIVEMFFACPKCGKRYFIGIQNNKCRRLQREIDIVNKKLNYKYSEKLVLKQKELTQMLKKEMDRINGKT